MKKHKDVVRMERTPQMKTDCFAFCNTATECWCRILNDMYCGKGESCSFYKTVEQEMLERKRAAVMWYENHK